MKYSYINENGKEIFGAAANNHFIYTLCGGVNGYNKLLYQIYKEKSTENNFLRSLFDTTSNIINVLSRKR